MTDVPTFDTWKQFRKEAIERLGTIGADAKQIEAELKAIESDLMCPSGSGCRHALQELVDAMVFNRDRFQSNEPTKGQHPEKPTDAWYHTRTDLPPPEYPLGPLQDSQSEIAARLYGDRKNDRRRLISKAMRGWFGCGDSTARAMRFGFVPKQSLTKP